MGASTPGITSGFVGAVGNTPLIRLKALSELTGCEILGKAEFMNPGGSVKDRAALGILLEAEEQGLLNPGGEERWHFWVPALAQNTLMTRVLKGDALTAEPLLVSLGVCALLALLGVGFVARVLRRAAVR